MKSMHILQKTVFVRVGEGTHIGEGNCCLFQVTSVLLIPLMTHFDSTLLFTCRLWLSILWEALECGT